MFKSILSLWLVSALFSTIALAGCNADNCLRALRATQRSDDSNAFCSAYLSQVTPTLTYTATATYMSAVPTVTDVNIELVPPDTILIITEGN